ncbi:MAG: LytTR family transcriptional regulator DNA-binding domain-containing protein [Oscillospiraceae bacterium]|nr:LytTR family transcriptional regulator DNA-binding domain-containing protein [Oscillospiraceae bacterium]
MQEKKYISVHSKRKDHNVEIDRILYVLMKRNDAEVHVYGGSVYVTRRAYSEFVKALGEDFMEIRRGCLVSVIAIQDITKQGVELINGECLKYTARRKREIISVMQEKKEKIISGYSKDGVPMTFEDYRSHYISFENMPFAFTDIEIVFSEKNKAVDWIFRYGNEALAKLEKLPLEKLIGSTFGSLFSNMDTKWLKNYKRSAIYGETLEIVEYSPEIDTYLKIISFPTFKGHCGCILFDINEIEFTGSEKILLSRLGKNNEENNR